MLKRILILGAMLVAAITFTACAEKTNVSTGEVECRGIITDRVYDCDRLEKVYQGGKLAYGIGKTLVQINGYYIPADKIEELKKLDEIAKQIDLNHDVIVDSVKQGK